MKLRVLRLVVGLSHLTGGLGYEDFRWMNLVENHSATEFHSRHYQYGQCDQGGNRPADDAPCANVFCLALRRYLPARILTGEEFLHMVYHAIAIFAVDGTKWQGECMRAIADYLRKHLPENSVILA